MDRARSHVERALALLPSTTLVNGYGPTEAITFSTYHLIPRDVRRSPSIPIGRPLANTHVYVLGPDKQPAPEGFPGEIWIGGDGLADVGDSVMPNRGRDLVDAEAGAGAEGQVSRVYACDKTHAS
jgi:non-ribosomal peptide synthetase component F